MTRRSNQQIWVVMSVVLMAFLSPVSAKVIYVDANAPGPTHDGSRWEDAYNYLQDALADADSAAKPVEIKVAQGIYTPDSNSANPNGTGNRNASFFLINSVAIKGGYAGYGQSEPNARDFELYKSILSGDLDGNDVEVNDPCDLLYEPTRAENSYHIVFSQLTDASAVLDGFTITGGNANGTGGYPFFENGGGGLYNGIHMPGSPTLINCTFIENSTWEKGGGILNSGYFDDSNPTITNCTFTRNWAGDGGGMYNNGWYGTCSPKLTNCVFSRNSSRQYGGGIASTGAFCDIILTNCTFTNNSGGLGGGMCTQQAILMLKNCMFTGNSAQNGGGMLNMSTIPMLTNCILWGDEPEEIYSNAIVNYSCVEGGWPGEGNIDADPCFVRPGYWELVTPAQASNPYPLDGATGVVITVALNWTAGANATSHDVYFGTTIIPPFVCNQTSTTYEPGALAYSTNYYWRIDELNFVGKTTGQTWRFTTQGEQPPPPTLVTEAYSYTSDTQLEYIWIEGDYHLKSQAGRWDANSQSWVKDDVTSPCIDAGNPGCPVGDELSPNGNRRNMGAYGGTAEASKSPTYWRSITDITNDWIVDSNDLKVFVGYWLQTGRCIPGDFDRSQFVDFNDFAILGGQWRQKGPGPGISYQIGSCIPVDFPLSAAAGLEPTRFTVTVEGQYILFEDMMRANCCPEELDIQMTVEGDLITVYEIEHTPMPCPCLCDFPITATFGPFDPATYILEVYQDGYFIGTTVVDIAPDG